MRKIALTSLVICGSLGAFILVACGSGIDPFEKSTKTDEQATLSGYDEDGEYLTCKRLKEGHACPMMATAFTDACLDGGHATVLCDGCEILCTEKVEMPEGNRVLFDGDFVEASYDSSKDIVSLRISYSACEAVGLRQDLLSNECGKSLPWSCGSYVYFKKDPGPCDEVIEDTVEFSMTGFDKRPADIEFKGKDSSVNVVVE